MIWYIFWLEPASSSARGIVAWIDRPLGKGVYSNMLYSFLYGNLYNISNTDMANKKEHTAKVCGEFPEFCYRAFDSEEYAKYFLDNGSFLLRCIYYYRSIENKARRDTTEGHGHTKEPGMVTTCWVSPNPTERTICERKQGHQEHHIEPGNALYLFCMSEPHVNIDHMRKNFGKHIVKINNPRKFAEDIYDYLFSIGQNVIINGCKIVYNKGQKLDRVLENNTRLDLPFKQKSESFKPDCEFRIVAIKLCDPCNQDCKFLDGEKDLECQHIQVNFNKPISYAHFVCDD
jgi:hypothetical protein